MTLLKQLQAELSNSRNFNSPIVRWGSIAAVFIIAWSILIAPYIQWREAQQQHYVSQIKYVTRLQALKVAATNWQQAEQAYLQAEKAMVNSLFQETSYVTAQTALLEWLRKQLKYHSLTLDSQRLQESERESDIGQRIGVIVRLHGDIFNILQFIHSLSEHTKLLNIDGLQINKQGQDNMSVTLQLSAFRLSSMSEREVSDAKAE